MSGVALQTFKNITSPNRKNLGEIVTVFRRKYVKSQSMATAKHIFQRLVFNPANQNFIDFLHELKKLAKDALGFAAQVIIEQFIYAKMPPHLKKSVNQAHMENGNYEQIVSHLEKELELNCLEAPDEMPINTVTQQAAQQSSDKPKQRCYPCLKNQFTIKISAVNSNERKTKPELIRTVPVLTIAVPKQTLTPTTKLQTIPKQTIQIIKETEDLDLCSHAVRPVDLTTPQRNATLEQTQQTDRLPGIGDRTDKTKSSKQMHKATQMGISKLQPKL